MELGPFLRWVLPLIKISASLNGFLRIRIKSLGRFVLFSKMIFLGMITPLISRRHLVEQMERVGFRSFAVIFVAAISVGAMFGLQFGELLRLYRAEALLGAASTVALAKEIAPVLGSFIVVGKVGSALAAEVANMRVRQEIDAMELMSVDPISYLIAPRVLATTLMMPLLFIEFVVVGVGSAYVVGISLFEVDSGMFFEKIPWLTEPQDMFRGLFKATVFGGILGLVSCYKGYYVERHSRGVGRATTSAVVLSLVAIIIVDFFISYLQWAGNSL